MTEDISIANMYDLSRTQAKEALEKFRYPWEVLPHIGDIILEIGKKLDSKEYRTAGENVWIAKSAVIYPGSYIAGPAIIGPGTEVRPGAFIRGKALVGSGCVIGNSTELKNCIIFDNVQVPHYNYVGDSVLGYKSHMGAGAVTSNVKQDKTDITVGVCGEKLGTGLRKFGAMLGDNVEVGCNAVLNPGTVIGRGSRVYPLSMVRGYVPAGSIYKKQGEIAAIK